MVTMDGMKICDRDFYLNLAHRKERRAFMEAQFREFGVEGIERFEALYEYEGTKHTSREGSRKSHIALMGKIVDEKIKTCLLLEDDVQLVEAFNVDNLREILRFEEADLVWLGGVPLSAFKYNDSFYLMISKSAALASVVKLKFAKRALESVRLGGFGLGSADSFYNACNYTTKERFLEIRRIFEDKDADKCRIIEKLSVKQFLYRHPLVCEWGDTTSDNDQVAVPNHKRRSCEQYLIGYRNELNRARSLSECNRRAVEINYNLREALSRDE